jgi:hypothetical protein
LGRRLLHEAGLAAAGQRHPEALRDRLGDLILNFEDVLQLAVVPLGPDVKALRDIDELNRDPHPVTRSPNAALEDRGDVQRVADLTQIAGPASE